MAKKPIDYTPQIQSAEERKRQRKAQEQEEKQREQNLLNLQAQSYGEVVREIFGRRITIDLLAGLLLDSRERLQSNPQLEAEWAASGTEYFRPANTQRKQPVGNNRATRSEQARNGDARNGHAPNPESRNGKSRTGQSPVGAPAQPPARSRPAAPPATPDLLGGLAPDQPGQGAPGEGGDHGEQP